MTMVTGSPARACRASVPPQPRTSSSGCAAIARTPLPRSTMLIVPDLSSPSLFTQFLPLETAAVFALDLQKSNQPAAAGHGLAAGRSNRAHHWTEHLPRPGSDRSLPGAKGRIPEPPARPVKPAEGAGVRARQGADEIVDRLVVLGPVNAPVLRAAPWGDGLAVQGLLVSRALAVQEPRDETEDHVGVRPGHFLVEGCTTVVGSNGETNLVDDVAGVHAIGQPHERIAGLLFTADERPVDGRAAAVMGQYRGVGADHAEPAAGKGGRANDLA